MPADPLSLKGPPLSVLEPSFSHRLGLTDSVEAALARYAGTHQLGRVSRVDRTAVDVLTEFGTVRADTRPTDPAVVVGDWVAVVDDVVDVIAPRRSTIVRAAASGESVSQPLVANVDVVFVVVATIPAPRLGMVERLVALAWDSGATPVVIITKADLVDDPVGVAADLGETAPGVELHCISATTGLGVEEVTAFDSPGRTLCLIGRSGAGKSTLANALLGDGRLEVAEIRRDGKGRHTTTHRELMMLPGGGVLVDTPGLRGAGIWLDGEGLAQAFPEIDELASRCRFSDCVHVTEPGCAILAALADGTLPQRRLDSWRKLQREAAWIAARGDARLRAERDRAWKRISREVRRSGRIRP
jgi:ribosome biogenesis GTPase / thiamine phosphate phosphatase